MGLLDWLGDLSGGSSLGDAFAKTNIGAGFPGGAAAPQINAPQPQQGMPPVQQTGDDQAPTVPMPQPRPADAPQGGDASIPMPQPRPLDAPTAPAAATAPAPLTPPEASTLYDGYKAAGGGGPVNVAGAPQAETNPGLASGLLGSVFGMNSSDARSLKNSLGAGLKSVGENWNKPGLAALSGSAGSAMEGGTHGEDKRIDQMLALIKQKQKAGDDSLATSLASVKLQAAKLQLQNLKDGKSSAWNKPPQQLYLDAMRLANGDQNVKTARTVVEKETDPTLKAEAQKKFDAIYSAAKDAHLKGVGLSPESAAEIAKTPGMTQENAVPQTAFSGKKFNEVIKPNQPFDQYFIDEKGQTRVLRGTKKSEAATTPGPQASSSSDTADAADET